MSSVPHRCSFEADWSTDLVSQGVILGSHGVTLGPDRPVTNIRPDKTNKMKRRRKGKDKSSTCLKPKTVPHLSMFVMPIAYPCTFDWDWCAFLSMFWWFVRWPWHGDALAIAQSHPEFSLFCWLLWSAKMLWWMTGTPHHWLPARGWACLDCWDPISLRVPSLHTAQWRFFFFFL